MVCIKVEKFLKRKLKKINKIMSERQVVIAIDAMGGENSPYKVLKGTEIFLVNEKKTQVVFFWR